MFSFNEFTVQESPQFGGRAKVGLGSEIVIFVFSTESGARSVRDVCIAKPTAVRQIEEQNKLYHA